MYPICYRRVSGGYLQPEPAMYSRCFRWFPGPLAPSVSSFLCQLTTASHLTLLLVDKSSTKHASYLSSSCPDRWLGAYWRQRSLVTVPRTRCVGARTEGLREGDWRVGQVQIRGSIQDLSKDRRCLLGDDRKAMATFAARGRRRYGDMAGPFPGLAGEFAFGFRIEGY